MVGAGTLNTQVTDIMAEGIIGHIEQIRQNVNGFRDTTFVINFESNMAYAADTVKFLFDKRPDILFKYIFLLNDRRPKGSSLANNNRAIVVTAGSRTSNEQKAEMVDGMTRLLNQGRIYFHAQFQSTFLSEVPDGYHNLRVIIEKQMRAYRRRHLPPPKGKETVVYSKTRYESADKDDFVMAVMYTPYTINLCERTPEFGRLLVSR